MSVNELQVCRESLLSSPQNITNDWRDVGGEFQMFGYNKFGLWVKIDINDSENVRVRVMGKLDKDGDDEYCLPILKVGAESVTVQQQYYEYDDDIDQNIFIEFETGGHISFGQVQVSCLIEGAPKARLLGCEITKIWR